MGSSPSLDNSPSEKCNQQNGLQSAKQNQSKYSSSWCSGTKDSKYKERSVYCLGMLCVSEKDLGLFEGKWISEMTVCKRGYADHWFVVLKVKTDMTQSKLYALHYYDNSTILVKKFKEEQEKKKLTKTIYCPTRPTDLKAIVLQCLTIVQENSYNYIDHNCQTVVTKIMEIFTDRKVNKFYSKFKIPIKGNLSKPLTSSYKGSQLEQEFLERFENKSLAVALSELEQENDHIESIIRNLCGLLISPQKELEHFKEKTLDQIYDKGLINKLKDMEKKQKNSDRSKIISQFARSTNLANTIWAIYAAAQNDSANEELLTPGEALEREIIENSRFLDVTNI